MLDQQTNSQIEPRQDQNVDDWEEAGDEEVPTVVLYVVAGMLLISFTLYLVVGGGHGHFH